MGSYSRLGPATRIVELIDCQRRVIPAIPLNLMPPQRAAVPTPQTPTPQTPSPAPPAAPPAATPAAPLPHQIEVPPIPRADDGNPQGHNLFTNYNHLLRRTLDLRPEYKNVHGNFQNWVPNVDPVNRWSRWGKSFRLNPRQVFTPGTIFSAPLHQVDWNEGTGRRTFISVSYLTHQYQSAHDSIETRSFTC